jgi:hypothetical protein
MSKAYIDFLYGDEPWEEFSISGRKIVWNGDETRVVELALSQDAKNDMCDQLAMKVVAASLQMQMASA